MSCVALNPSVRGETNANRILFYDIVGGSPTLITRNVAFDGMTNIDGTTDWDLTSTNGARNNGESITAEQIQSTGTIGNRFDPEDGWTVSPGKLPGLFGEAVELPAHLQ